MKTILLAVMALLLAGCTRYPAYTGPVAVDGSLCEGIEGFCDPVEKLHITHSQDYLKAVVSGKQPPATDPSRGLGYTDEERGMVGRMPNARTTAPQ